VKMPQLLHEGCPKRRAARMLSLANVQVVQDR
jgi:hypothetical protein